MAQHLQDGKPREDHVAELLPATRGREAINGHTADGLILRQQRRERRELIVAIVARERGVIARDFLQAQHIKIRHRARCVDDATQVYATVDAEAPLNVPSDQFHGERRKREERFKRRRRHCTGVRRARWRAGSCVTAFM